MQQATNAKAEIERLKKEAIAEASGAKVQVQMQRSRSQGADMKVSAEASDAKVQAPRPAKAGGKTSKAPPDEAPQPVEVVLTPRGPGLLGAIFGRRM